ncbi:MAG: acetylhydrolase [Verrucomicrobiota bacterium]
MSVPSFCFRLLGTGWLCVLVGGSLLFAEKSSPTKIETLLLDPVDATRDRVVPLKVYRVPSDEPQPVVVFYNRRGGSRDGNPYLGEHWARHGYTVVFMQHAGSDRDVWLNAPRAERLTALKAAASGPSTLQRFLDVPFVIDQLETWNAEEGHALAGTLNLERIGMSGHSYGAVTTLGVSGRKLGPRQFREPRIDAFLPMSPNPGNAMTAEQSFGHLTEPPVLCMTGTEDRSFTEPDMLPEKRQEVYRALPPTDKYQLVLKGAEHHAFSDGERAQARVRNPNHHPVILKLSTQFWDAYLKSDESAQKWLQSDAPVDEGLLEAGDVWEWK